MMKAKPAREPKRAARESLPQLCISYNLYLPEGLVVEIEGYGDKPVACLLDAMRRADGEYTRWHGIEQIRQTLNPEEEQQQ